MDKNCENNNNSRNTAEGCNKEEEQYLNLIKEILKNGENVSDRTGTGTRRLFGRSMRYSLENNAFPLLTTKKVAYNTIMRELIFFIRGETDNKILRKQNVRIWDGNSTREYFDSIGIDRETDDLGPVYGFQWRHCGAKYKTCHDDYTGKGIDQLQNVIDQIKKNPTSRRLVVCAWNPCQLNEMALPPCHCLFQFQVSQGKLSCILYQRSCDVGLGVVFNIASYAALTIIVAKLCNLEAGEFIHFMGDVHIYNDHIEALLTQIERKPFAFPTLKLKEKEYNKLEDFEFEDFILENYESHPPIKMKMSV
ncbi:hypothetical protein NUSPORA_00247 [Nucleospora cyclopteri]